VSSLKPLQPILNSALDAVIVIDAHGIVRAWNRGAEETFGWSDAEAVGEPMAALVVPEHLREGHNQGMARFLRTGEAHVIGRRIEIDALHRDGRVFPVELSISEAELAGERLFIGYLRDITDRRHAEEELRKSALRLADDQARLRFLDDLNRVTANLADADDILVNTTRMLGEHLQLSCCAYADMDADEDGFTIRGDWSAPGSPSIVGHYHLADFGALAVRNLGAGQPLIVNNNLEELAPHEAATIQSIGITATICMPLVKDGRLRALMAIHDKVPRVWTEGELALLTEVTERSWAHVERVGVAALLRDSNSRFQAAVRAVQGVLWTNDAEGRMAGDQPGWSALTGQTLEEYQDYGWASAVHPEDVEATLQAWNEAVAERKPFVFEHRLRRHDRTWGTFSIRAIPTFDPAGSILEWVGVHTDVTLQRANEDALRDFNVHLEHRVSESLAERRLLAELVEGTDAFVQVLDKDFRWLAINRAAASEFQRMFGVTPRTGQSMLDVLADQPELRGAAQALWARALGGRSSPRRPSLAVRTGSGAFMR